MTDEERNKIIAEALGLCWHVREYPIDVPTFSHCKKCRILYLSNLDFSTWPGFGIIMERGPTKKWWPDFLDCIGDFYPYPGFSSSIDIEYVNCRSMFAELSTWLFNNYKNYGKPDGAIKRRNHENIDTRNRAFSD